MLPTLSVLIPAKNEEKVIAKCLDSLLNSDYPKNKLEIIVNVNGSSDNTAKICKKYKRVKTIVTGPKNCRAEALNEIIPKAKGEIIGIFDADSFIEKNCLTKAVKRFSDENVMGVSGLVKSIKSNIISRSISLEKSFGCLLEYIISNKLGYNTHFVGKNMYIRKKVFNKLGFLDVVTYTDDVELSLRMKENNYKVVFEPDAIAWEQEPDSIKVYYKQRTRWTRSVLKIEKLEKNRKKRFLLADLSHCSANYIAPFGIIILELALFFTLYNISQLFLLPFLIFFLLLVSGVGYSKVFYGEPLTDILYLPVWFFLSLFYTFLIFPKTFVEERLNKQFIWHDIERKKSS